MFGNRGLLMAASGSAGCVATDGQPPQPKPTPWSNGQRLIASASGLSTATPTIRNTKCHGAIRRAASVPAERLPSPIGRRAPHRQRDPCWHCASWWWSPRRLHGGGVDDRVRPTCWRATYLSGWGLEHAAELDGFHNEQHGADEEVAAQGEHAESGRCQLGWGLSGIGACRARWAGCRWYGSGCGSQSGDLVPDGESSGHFGVIVVSGEAMAAGPEVRRDHVEHRQEPLGCAGGAEAFHGAFAVPGRLVRVLRPVKNDVKVLRGSCWLRERGWSAWPLWTCCSARCVVDAAGGDRWHGVAFGDDGASLGFGDDAAVSVAQ